VTPHGQRQRGVTEAPPVTLARLHAQALYELAEGRPIQRHGHWKEAAEQLPVGLSVWLGQRLCLGGYWGASNSPDISGAPGVRPSATVIQLNLGGHLRHGERLHAGWLVRQKGAFEVLEQQLAHGLRFLRQRPETGILTQGGGHAGNPPVELGIVHRERQYVAERLQVAAVQGFHVAKEGGLALALGE
jgi:hypothetical protein